MKTFLESIGVAIPSGAVSYGTEGSSKIIFLIGKTAEFVSCELTSKQVAEMKRGNCFGSFGWNL